ncbi:MAG TPA: tricarboxylate transporter [Gammaproteobacteria bacterium]|nr:tricarboxylate transporter [Gammaproteobacteria bacterium]
MKSLISTFIVLPFLFLPNSSFAEIDFSGKTIEWVVPFSQGGGADAIARFFSPLLAEELPGQPIVKVVNMPGAGSTKGANWFSSLAPTDGSVIFSTSGSTQFPFLLDDPRVKYDYDDWEVVLATATGGVAYLPKDLGERWNKDPRLVLDTNFVFASQGPTRLDLVPLLAWDMLGMKVEPIFGIKGRADGRLMFERGFVNIDYQTSSSFLSKVQPLVDKGEAVPIMTWGALDELGSIVRDPNFPDIPTFREVYAEIHGTEPSGNDWNAWKAFFIAGFPAQKMVVIDKDVSPDIIDAYSSAFESIIGRENFIEISKKYLGVYHQVTGDQANQFKKIATQIDPTAIRWIKDWLNQSYTLEL